MKPRKLDGLVWLKEDVSTKDGTHPSDSGREKVANLLLDFFQKNPLLPVLLGTWPGEGCPSIGQLNNRERIH